MEISTKSVNTLLILPPISWFSNIKTSETIILEGKENFVKGSFRNRFDISGPNGLIKISIPIKNGRNHHQLYEKTETAIDLIWIKTFKKTITSCYANAPYFEHYADSFFLIFEKNTNLFTLNTLLLNWVLSKIKLKTPIVFTEEYLLSVVKESDITNKLLQQSQTIENDSTKPYPQVFESKFGFTPNLSIIDLVFNCGTQSLSYL